jgi:Tfp pilus assembly protein PilE
MRGLSLLDILVILIVVGLLLLAAKQDFVHYDGRSPEPPAGTPAAGR